MKRFFGFMIVVLSLSIPAFAAKNSSNISIAAATNVGSTKLAAGNYKISWTGSDAAVQVKFEQNGKTLATAPAKVVPAKNNVVSLGTKAVNGVDQLESIQLDKLNLVFTGAASAAE